jgi:hypothetical protein
MRDEIDRVMVVTDPMGAAGGNDGGAPASDASR